MTTNDKMCSDWLDAARAFWRSQNSSMTQVRRVICDIAVRKETAFDAESLHRESREVDALISLSTVYRTLRSLAKAGLIAEVERVDDKRYFMVRHGSQRGDSTLHCTDCNEVFPMDNPCLELREGESVRRMGFTPRRLSLRVDSSCDELKQRGSCDRRRAGRADETDAGGH